MSDPLSKFWGMNIDCDLCTAAPLACGDCVVSVLLGMPEFAVPEQPAIADEHVAAIDALAQGGLIPPLRLVVGAGNTPNTGAKRRAG
ncbi:unannotated protein [freshwater metagenome]|uniref:Unannotated protein n=1 Tax=freshwater metagenome TaxID=449393 RepID=A0A6J6IDP2_9ZZZZ